MSWIRDHPLTWIQRLGVRIIGSGRVPRHVAFIMDGNRRYAKQHNFKKIEGHTIGFDRLAETLQWCLELGIKEVTVYAFSIENFKRTQDEIDALMELATQKFQRLLDEKDKLMEHGVHIRILGNLSLLPLELRRLMCKAMILTKNNDKAVLNIAFAYTAREELSHCIRQTVEGVTEGLLSPSDVSQDLITRNLYTNRSPTPDLLIRTSGEVRLSDFLLWQVSCSCMYFADVLWPEFTVWHLLAAVFYYQRCLQRLEKVSQLESSSDNISLTTAQSNQVEEFLGHVAKHREEWLLKHAEEEVKG